MCEVRGVFRTFQLENCSLCGTSSWLLTLFCKKPHYKYLTGFNVQYEKDHRYCRSDVFVINFEQIL